MNTRDRAFRDVASDVGLADLGLVARAMSAGDVNKDGFPDFVFSGDAGATFALSDGRGRFSLSDAPEVATGAWALQLVDYDADGLLDLLAWTPDGPRLARNLGDRWTDASETAVSALTSLPALGTGHGLAVADLDLDGDSDLVAGGPGPVTIAENQAAPGRTSTRVSLRGLVTNRLGIGAKVQVRAGGLRSRHEGLVRHAGRGAGGHRLRAGSSARRRRRAGALALRHPPG